MQLALRSLLLIAVFPLLFLNNTAAQYTYIDSLNTLLKQGNLSEAEQVNTRCKLAKANLEKNLSLSFEQAYKALSIGEKMKDGRGKAMAFATLIQLYVWKKDLKQAYESRDSAMYYAGKTKDPVTIGFVWFRNGWLDLVNDENDKSIAKMLKALDYFKGQQAFEHESMVYHYLASFYGHGNDPVKQQKYAELCYAITLKDPQVNMLNTAYLTLGQSYADRFKLDTANRRLLDTALAIFKKALSISEQEPGQVLLWSNVAAIALNTANDYFQYFPKTYRDSAEKYIEIAIGIATRINQLEVLANCYGLRSEYAMQDQKYNEAEKVLLTGLASIEGSVMKMPLTKSRMFQGLANIAERKGDNEAALKYLKQYVRFNKEAFDEEKINSTQRIEAQYQSEKKEQEIAYLQQKSMFARKSTLLYVILSLTGIAALLFLLLSYNYKLKISIRKQELIDKEKTAAELRAQLKEAEALQLKTEQDLLKERQERLQRELLAGTLQIEEKNELLELLPEKVKKESHLSVDEQIKRILITQKRIDKDFEEHKTDFFETNPAFFDRLQQQANDRLTRLDLKYCSYILMGLSNKEVSIRLGIEPKSIRMAHYRIKQKFGLGKADSLDNFIRSQK